MGKLTFTRIPTTICLISHLLVMFALARGLPANTIPEPTPDAGAASLGKVLTFDSGSVNEPPPMLNPCRDDYNKCVGALITSESGLSYVEKCKSLLKCTDKYFECDMERMKNGTTTTTTPKAELIAE